MLSIAGRLTDSILLPEHLRSLYQHSLPSGAYTSVQVPLRFEASHMVVIDEKDISPPPYSRESPAPPFPHSQSIGISALPPNLLLHIIYMMFPGTHRIYEDAMEHQRDTLYWLTYHLRLVNHTFYIACMYILRSTYLPVYQSLIRAPYTSDPFPVSSSATSHDGLLETIPREVRVFDTFIAIKAREDLFIDASQLHITREELFKDLFDLMQPRSRLEDLVLHYGIREGVVHVTSPTASDGTTSRHIKARSISFSALSISFSPRRVGLVLTTSGRKRTIVEVTRVPHEKLELPAKKLVKQLRVWLDYA